MPGATTDSKQLVNAAWTEANEAGDSKLVEHFRAIVKKYTTTDWASVAIEAGLLSPSDISPGGPAALAVDPDVKTDKTGDDAGDAETIVPEIFRPTVKSVKG